MNDDWEVVWDLVKFFLLGSLVIGGLFTLLRLI